MTDNNQDDFAKKRRFIIKLGKALHRYGTPSHRLEAHLHNVATSLGMKASFIASPTSLMFLLSEEDADKQNYNHVLRVKPGDIDLGALAYIDELVDEVDSKKRSLSEATQRLEEIPNQPAPYGKLLTFLAFGGAGGAFSVLMGANWSSILLATLMGCIVAMITFWAERSSRVLNMLDPFVALTVALLSSAAALYDPTVNVPLVILSSIIIYIPGLALTVGLSELASRNLVAGTTRIMDALMTLFELFFGAFLGIALASILWGTINIVPAEKAESWTFWIAITILAFSLVVLFRMRIKDALWGVTAGYIGFGATLWGSQYLGASLGAFTGALALGIYSNLFSRFMNLPSSLARLPGLVMLVPGSKIYIGLSTAVSGQVLLNTPDVGAQSFLIFMSLVAGLLFADVIVPSRKTL